jgi:hypothetical protein
VSAHRACLPLSFRESLNPAYRLRAQFSTLYTCNTYAPAQHHTTAKYTHLATDQQPVLPADPAACASTAHQRVSHYSTLLFSLPAGGGISPPPHLPESCRCGEESRVFRIDSQGQAANQRLVSHSETPIALRSRLHVAVAQRRVGEWQ